MSYGMFKKEDLYMPGGQMYTQSLFREWGNEDALLTYTKHKQDGATSLKELYIGFCVDDPTELEFAEHVFGDYLFWEHLKSVSWMAKEVEDWKRIVDVKRKSKAFRTVIQEATNADGRNRFTASKYLIEEPWKAKDGRTKDGRKARKESRETTEAAAESRELKEDFERIRSHLN